MTTTTMFRILPLWMVTILSVHGTDIIRLDPSILRSSSTVQVYLVNVSISDLFEAPNITLAGLDEETPSVVYTKLSSKRTTRESGRIEIDWTGTIQGTTGDAVIRRGSSGKLTGSLTTMAATYELVEVPGGIYEVRKISWGDFLDEGDDDLIANGAPDVDISMFASVENTAATIVTPDASGSVEVSVGSASGLQRIQQRSLLRKDRLAAENTQVDLLLVVTNAGMCQYAGISSGECENNEVNRASIETRIPQLIDQTNKAFQQVGSTVEIRHVSTVYLHPAYDYLGPTTSTLSFLRLNVDVAAWREAVGADLVAGLVADGDYCGYASVGPCTNCFASVTNVYCFGQYSFTHEIGHNFGCLHNREGTTYEHPYGHGYRSPPVFRTVMAYSCDNVYCPRIPYFSTPDFLTDGLPMGDESHDNARLAQENALTVAGYKSVPTESPTASPTTLSPSIYTPTTAEPTTPAPTTAEPTTLAPTTVAPTTLAPTTAEPTTLIPTTAEPTTLAPITVAPTTLSQTTLTPTTAEPTTLAPTTAEPTTLAPTTAEPTTLAPTTADQTTLAPMTAEPTTLAPTTAETTTLAPTTAEPTTLAPTTASPTTMPPTHAHTDPPTTPPTAAPPPRPPTGPPSFSMCFSGAMAVEVEGRGFVPMDQLQIGDMVRSGRNQFSKVYGFYHLEREVKAEYLAIGTDSQQEPLEISANHLVFVNSVVIPAKHIKIGDKLGELTVTTIHTIKRQGIYSPATFDGTIVVNGVLASTYTSQLDHSPVNEHTAVHMILSYHRLVCRLDFHLCETETYSNHGFSHWNLPLIQLVNKINQQGPSIQVLSTVVFLPMFAAVYVVEQLSQYPMLLAYTFVAVYVLRTKKKTKEKTA